MRLLFLIGVLTVIVSGNLFYTLYRANVSFESEQKYVWFIPIFGLFIGLTIVMLYWPYKKKNENY